MQWILNIRSILSFTENEIIMISCFTILAINSVTLCINFSLPPTYIFQWAILLHNPLRMLMLNFVLCQESHVTHAFNSSWHRWINNILQHQLNQLWAVIKYFSGFYRFQSSPIATYLTVLAGIEYLILIMVVSIYLCWRRILCKHDFQLTMSIKMLECQLVRWNREKYWTCSTVSGLPSS